MLRKWNPGTNEPRELREEGEVEVVETLVEVDEEPAEEAGRRGFVGDDRGRISPRLAFPTDPKRSRVATGDDRPGQWCATRPARPRAPCSPAHSPSDRGQSHSLIAIPGPTRSFGVSS